MAMVTEFTAWYDASGAEDDPTRRPLGVCGLVSTEKDWLGFEKDWQAVLEDPEYRVPFLHMKQFTQFRPPFDEDWRGNEEKRAGFLTRLSKVIQDHVKYCWVVHIPLHSFEAVNKDYMLKETFGGPYTLAAFLSWGSMEEWVGKTHPGQPLHHVFEAGDRGQDFFQAFLKWAGIYVSIRKAQDQKTGKWWTPFQAADYMAYEYTTEIMRYDQPIRTHKSRGSFRALLGIPCETGEFTYQRIKSFCEKQPDICPRRR
jgi:hypothetical protein